MKKDHIEEVMKRVIDAPKILRHLHSKIIRGVLEQVEEGITRHHLEVMKLLDEDGKMSISQIGEELVIAKPQMTRLIDELTRVGAIEREPDPKDRRRSIISLTQKGRQTVTSTMDTFQQAVREKLEPLTEQELDGLSASIDKMSQIIQKL